MSLPLSLSIYIYIACECTTCGCVMGGQVRTNAHPKAMLRWLTCRLPMCPAGASVAHAPR